MKENKFVLNAIVIVAAFILIQLFGYKIALLLLNSPDEGNGYKTLFNIKDEIKIESKDASNPKTYLDMEYEELEGFTYGESQSTKLNNSYYLYKDDTQTVLAGYKVGSGYNYYDDIIKSSINDKETNVKLLEKVNVYNNFEVIKYLQKHYKDKVSIFSNTNDVKLHNLMNTYANKKIEEGEIRYLKGNLEGFIIINKTNTIFQVNIKNNDKYYYFDFFNSTDNEYFTLDKVISIISTIKFK